MDQLLVGITPISQFTYTWIDANLTDTTIQAGHTYTYHYVVDGVSETSPTEHSILAITTLKTANDMWNNEKPAPKNTLAVSVDMTYQVKMGWFSLDTGYV